MSASEPDPVLVVVDMQRVFAERDSPWAVPDYDSIVPRIEALVAAHRDRVVFTRFLVPDEPEGSWREYYRVWDFALRPGAERLLELTPPFPTEGAPILEKPQFSKFGPELQRMAGAGGTLILCGVTTECCVLSTGLEAVDAGMFVRLVTDATATVDRPTHDSALRVASVFTPQMVLTTVEEELALVG